MQGVVTAQKTCSTSLSHRGAVRGSRGNPLQRGVPRERLPPVRVVQDMRQGTPDKGVAAFWGRHLGGFKEHTAQRQGPSTAAMHPSLPEDTLLTARPMGPASMAGTRVPGAGGQMAAASARGLHAVPRTAAGPAPSTPFTPPAGSQLSRVRRLVSLFEQGVSRQGAAAAAAADLAAARPMDPASMAGTRVPGAGRQMAAASARGLHAVPKAARTVRDLVARFSNSSAVVELEAAPAAASVEVQPPANTRDAVAGRSPGEAGAGAGAGRSGQEEREHLGSYLASRGAEALGLAVLGIFAVMATALAPLFKRGVGKGAGRPRSSSKRLDAVSWLLAPAAPLMANTPELPEVQASLRADKYTPCPTLVLAEVAVASKAVGTLAIGAGALVGTLLLGAYRTGTRLSQSYQSA